MKIFSLLYDNISVTAIKERMPKDRFIALCRLCTVGMAFASFIVALYFAGAWALFAYGGVAAAVLIARE